MPVIHDSSLGDVLEIKHHIHNNERWFGAAAVPDSPAHVADRIGTTTSPYQMDAGDNTWGSWLQVAGEDDWPAGWAFADIHRIEIVGIERTNATHFIQIAFGDIDAATALAAGDYTEFVFRPITIQGRAAPIPLINKRIREGSMVWVRVLVVGQNTGTVDFFIGAHGYAE